MATLAEQKRKLMKDKANLLKRKSRINEVKKRD